MNNCQGSTINIRISTDNDLASMVAVFSESVHQIAARSYTAAQLDACAPESPDLKQWQIRFALLKTLIAEFGGVIGGFISYTDNGHIEFLFTSPAFARQGVASRLFEAAVQDLHSKNARNLSTEASLEARPFFELMGFSVVDKQMVERNGIQKRDEHKHRENVSWFIAKRLGTWKTLYGAGPVRTCSQQ